jgi:hypothetical protein
LGDAQTAPAKPFHELPHGHFLGTESNQFGVPEVGNVIMICIECFAGDPRSLCECVQFAQRVVAYQVSPENVVGRPQGLIDQDRHHKILNPGLFVFSDDQLGLV